MAVKIRFARRGRSKKVLFDIVVADSKSPRDGRFIEKLGLFNPHSDENSLNFERALYWVMVGAQPTDTARSLLSREGVMLKKHLQVGVNKGAITQEVADQRFEVWKNSKLSQQEAEAATKAKIIADKKAAEEAEMKKLREAERKAVAVAKAELEKAKEEEAAPAEEAKAEAPAEEVKAEEVSSYISASNLISSKNLYNDNFFPKNITQRQYKEGYSHLHEKNEEIMQEKDLSDEPYYIVTQIEPKFGDIKELRIHREYEFLLRVRIEGNFKRNNLTENLQYVLSSNEFDFPYNSGPLSSSPLRKLEFSKNKAESTFKIKPMELGNSELNLNYLDNFLIVHTLQFYFKIIK